MARPNFEEKTFAGGSKTVKFVNVFSLESFPLHGKSGLLLGKLVWGSVILCRLPRSRTYLAIGQGAAAPSPPASQAIVINNAYTVSYLVIFECSAVSCHDGQHVFSKKRTFNLIENTF